MRERERERASEREKERESTKQMLKYALLRARRMGGAGRERGGDSVCERTAYDKKEKKRNKKRVCRTIT